MALQELLSLYEQRRQRLSEGAGDPSILDVIQLFLGMQLETRQIFLEANRERASGAQTEIKELQDKLATTPLEFGRQALATSPDGVVALQSRFKDMMQRLELDVAERHTLVSNFSATEQAQEKIAKAMTGIEALFKELGLEEPFLRPEGVPTLPARPITIEPTPVSTEPTPARADTGSNNFVADLTDAVAASSSRNFPDTSSRTAGVEVVKKTKRPEKTQKKVKAPTAGNSDQHFMNVVAEIAIDIPPQFKQYALARSLQALVVKRHLDVNNVDQVRQVLYDAMNGKLDPEFYLTTQKTISTLGAFREAFKTQVDGLFKEHGIDLAAARITAFELTQAIKAASVASGLTNPEDKKGLFEVIKMISEKDSDTMNDLIINSPDDATKDILNRLSGLFRTSITQNAAPTRLPKPELPSTLKIVILERALSFKKEEMWVYRDLDKFGGQLIREGIIKFAGSSSDKRDPSSLAHENQGAILKLVAEEANKVRDFSTTNHAATVSDLLRNPNFIISKEFRDVLKNFSDLPAGAFVFLPEIWKDLNRPYVMKDLKKAMLIRYQAKYNRGK